MLAIVFLAAPALAKSRVQIIEPGEYHGDEVATRTGDRWMALERTGNRARWRETSVVVTKVHHQFVDADNPTIKSGKRVSTALPAEPALLIRGLTRLNVVEPGLVHGPLALKIGDQHALSNGTVLEVIRQQPRHRKRNIDATPYLIRMRRGAKQQVIYEGPPDSETMVLPSVLVMGDIDGDGNPDLVLKIPSYNQETITLFLSSRARGHQLVRPVASHVRTGC